jgi:hypothetical protein
MCAHCARRDPSVSWCDAVGALLCRGCYDRQYEETHAAAAQINSPLRRNKHLSGISVENTRPISVEGGQSISVEVEPPEGAADRAESGEDDVDRSARCAESLGIATPLGMLGPCVLPRHGRHEALTVNDGHGHWELDCPTLEKRLSLAQVRAAMAYANVPYNDSGAERKLTGARRNIRPPSGRSPEISRWWERLHHEAGLLDPHPVPLEVPADLPNNARIVGEGIYLLLGLRRERWITADFTWSRRFAQAWTGLTETQARAGLSELLRRHIVVRTGSARGARGRPHVYRLGLLVEVLGSTDAIVEALKKDFDAIELES